MATVKTYDRGKEGGGEGTKAPNKAIKASQKTIGGKRAGVNGLTIVEDTNAKDGVRGMHEVDLGQRGSMRSEEPRRVTYYGG